MSQLTSAFHELSRHLRQQVAARSVDDLVDIDASVQQYHRGSRYRDITVVVADETLLAVFRDVVDKFLSQHAYRARIHIQQGVGARSRPCLYISIWPQP
jgi:hypothetical protein